MEQTLAASHLEIRPTAAMAARCANLFASREVLSVFFFSMMCKYHTCVLARSLRIDFPNLLSWF